MQQKVQYDIKQNVYENRYC